MQIEHFQGKGYGHSYDIKNWRHRDWHTHRWYNPKPVAINAGGCTTVHAVVEAVHYPVPGGGCNIRVAYRGSDNNMRRQTVKGTKHCATYGRPAVGSVVTVQIDRNNNLCDVRYNPVAVIQPKYCPANAEVCKFAGLVQNVNSPTNVNSGNRTNSPNNVQSPTTSYNNSPITDTRSDIRDSYNQTTMTTDSSNRSIMGDTVSGSGNNIGSTVNNYGYGMVPGPGGVPVPVPGLLGGGNNNVDLKLNIVNKNANQNAGGGAPLFAVSPAWPGPYMVPPPGGLPGGLLDPHAAFIAGGPQGPPGPQGPQGPPAPPPPAVEQPLVVTTSGPVLTMAPAPPPPPSEPAPAFPSMPAFIRDTPAPAEKGGMNRWAMIGSSVVVVLLILLAVWYMRRRRGRGSAPMFL